MRTGIACWLSLGVLVAPAAAADEALAPETLAALKDSTVYIKVEKDQDRASGSGFLVRVAGDTGYVVTNHHVVTLTRQIRHVTYPRPARSGRNLILPAPQVRIEEQVIDSPSVTVLFASGTRNERSFPGEVVASDKKVDLAVVKVPGVKSLPHTIDPGRAAELTETVPVYAFGFPMGRLLATGRAGPAVTVTKGAITSVRRNERDEVALVQIDSDLNPGNSGGPVVDARGRLVGIAVAKVRDTRIGLAVPPRVLTEMLEGRVGEARLEMSGAKEVRVEVDLVDPLERIRSVALYHAPAASAKGRDGAEGLAGLLDAHRVGLKREGRTAIGSFRLEVPAGREVALAYEVAWTGADGKVHRGERRSFVAEGPEAPEVAAEATPAPKPSARPAAKAVQPSPAPDRPEPRPAGKVLADAELTRALQELLDPSKADRAAGLLARTKPDARRREEVVKALKAVAAEKELKGFARSNSVKALGVWGTEQEVDFLLPLAADENIFVRSESLEALSWLGGPKAAEAIADRAENVHDHGRALKCLARMGSVAEDAVVTTLLGNAKVSLRLDGCNLLKAIGTERTLHFLEDMARDDGSEAVRLAAENAVKAVKERQQRAEK